MSGGGAEPRILGKKLKWQEENLGNITKIRERLGLRPRTPWPHGHLRAASFQFDFEKYAKAFSEEFGAGKPESPLDISKIGS